MVSIVTPLVFFLTAFDNPDVLGLQLKVRWALERNQVGLAESLLEEARTLEPDNPDTAFLGLQVLERKFKDGPSILANETLASQLLNYLSKYPADYRFAKKAGILSFKNPSLSRTQSLLDSKRCLSKALELLDENEPSLYMELAESHYYIGQVVSSDDFFSAADHFEKAIQFQPDLEWAYYHAAQNLEKSGQFRSALRRYLDFVAMVGYLPKSTQLRVRISIAKLQVLLNRDIHAQESLFSLLQQGEVGADDYWNLADFFFGHGMFRFGCELLDLMDEPFRADPQWVVTSIRYLLMSGQSVQAFNLGLQSFKTIRTGQARRMVSELTLQAAILSQQKEMVDLLEPFADRFYENPMSRFYWRALTFWRSPKSTKDWYAGETPRGHEHIVWLAKEAGAEEALDLLFARSFASFQFFDQAITYYHRIRRDLRKNSDLKLELADMYALSGNLDKSFKVYRDLVEEKLSNSSVYNNYGYFLLESNQKLGQSKSLIERSLELDPECGACADSLGWVYFLQGDYVAAEAWLRKALKLTPLDATKLEHLGDILQKHGNQNEARTFWSRSMQARDEFFLQEGFFRLLDKLDPQP